MSSAVALSEAEEKKRKRLEKNRESARECRKRKKDKIDMLRLQLTRLEAENIQFRLKLKVGNEFPDESMGSEPSTISNSKDQIPFQLENMLMSGASDSEIRTTVEELQERYADYGLNRRTTLAFHISQLRRCLLPTQTTRCILWMIGCSHLFHNSDGTDKVDIDENIPQKEIVQELFKSLMEETEPSIDQKKTIYSFTDDGIGPFPKLQSLSQNSNAILDRLEEIVCTKNESLDSEMSSLQRSLDARQVFMSFTYISCHL